MQDIEVALKLGVSASIEEKLLKRRKSCNSQLRESCSSSNSETQDEQHPLCSVYDSKCVTVKESQECGRFLEVRSHHCHALHSTPTAGSHCHQSRGGDCNGGPLCLCSG